MLDHRTAAAADAPPAPRPVAVSYAALVPTDGRAFSLEVRGRRVRVVRCEQPGCTCASRAAWSRHLVQVELLRLRVQTWTSPRGGGRA